VPLNKRANDSLALPVFHRETSALPYVTSNVTLHLAHISIVKSPEPNFRSPLSGTVIISLVPLKLILAPANFSMLVLPVIVPDVVNDLVELSETKYAVAASGYGVTGGVNDAV
jgi:hypothetical protein